MHRTETCLAVLLGAFLVLPPTARAADAADQVMLAPGKSISMSDAANPGLNVLITAPADAYVNLSRLIAAGEKDGMYSVMTLQIRPASDIVANADGSLSLRPVVRDPFFVPKDAAPGPGRVVLESGTAVFDQGRAVLHSAHVVDAPPLPAGGSATSGTALHPGQTLGNITFQSFNVGTGSSVTLSQPNSDGTNMVQPTRGHAGKLPTFPVGGLPSGPVGPR